MTQTGESATKFINYKAIYGVEEEEIDDFQQVHGHAQFADIEIN
jgi:hypothetical protein